MGNKKFFLNILSLIIITVSICGCTNKSENASIVEPSADEVSTSEAVSSEVSASEDSSTDLNSEYYMNKPFDNPEAGRAPAIPGNGKHFVKYDGKIYFRIPGKYAMKEAALWGDYDCVMKDNSCTIASLDASTGEITNLFEDSSYGAITISGGRFILSESSDGEELPVQSVSLDGSDRRSLPGTKVYGTLPSGEYFVTGAYESDHKLHLYICDLNGENKEIQNSSEIFYYAGIGGDHLFCVTKSDNSSYGRLCGYDLQTGEEIIYGDFPQIVKYADYPAEPEYLAVQDGLVLVQMSVYEGSGHFYTGCKHFRATCDKPGSLEETFPAGAVSNFNSGDLKSPVVYVPSPNPPGRYIYAEGVPGTCGVDDDGNVGYFDDYGFFKPVASYYGYTLYDNYEDRANTEIAELVDGNIYVVRNSEKYAPEACIGWRDAYRRYETRIEKINVNKKDVFSMAHIISDPLKDLVADDILAKFRANTKVENFFATSEEAQALGSWVQDTIGKENFPEDIRKMGTSIGNHYEFCFGTDTSNNFDDNIPRMYKTYYALKEYYTTGGKWGKDFYDSLMEENEYFGNGNPENIINMYAELQEFITACNNIVRGQK
jgi:hypothetical protein